MNRQVWKLKEYELPIDPYQNAPMSPNGLNSSAMAASISLSSNNGNAYPPTSVIGSTGTASISMSSSSSSSFYEPLTEGKWRDGWLPPAEVLQWRFPDECGDELEIVESVVVDGDPSWQSRRTTLESSIQGSFSSSSKDGDGEDSIGWAREKAGFSGRIRGRLDMWQGTEPRTSELEVGVEETPESTAPIGMKISRTMEIPARTGTTSPRSPEFDTTVMPTGAGFGGRRETGMDEYSFEVARPHGPSRTRADELEANASAVGGGGPKVIEKVSRYVRWDPHVAWARQAIWGNTSEGSAGTSGHSGKSRGSHTHTSNASSKNKGGEWMVGRVRRQIRDILIFGEVSQGSDVKRTFAEL